MMKVWDIQQKYQMCILFNRVSPVWVFKRGTTFDQNAEKPFADYDSKDVGDVTETDEDGKAQQYNPVDYVYV